MSIFQIYSLNKLLDLYVRIFKIMLMMSEDVLNNLQKRNDLLKFKLIHEQLNFQNYSFHFIKKYCLLLINEYKKHNSLFKSSLNVGMDYNTVLDWYVQGLFGNSQFRKFFLAVNDMGIFHDVESEIKNDGCEDVSELECEYVISQYGDGWSYKTFIDGEKIFIIANELDDLKKKVKLKHLPLD